MNGENKFILHCPLPPPCAGKHELTELGSISPPLPLMRFRDGSPNKKFTSDQLRTENKQELLSSHPTKPKNI